LTSNFLTSHTLTYHTFETLSAILRSTLTSIVAVTTIPSLT
jgi:hypothetical protein